MYTNYKYSYINTQIFVFNNKCQQNDKKRNLVYNCKYGVLFEVLKKETPQNDRLGNCNRLRFKLNILIVTITSHYVCSLIFVSWCFYKLLKQLYKNAIQYAYR